MSHMIWTPRVGEMIKRRNDSDAPCHTVTGVRGFGESCAVLIDGIERRWWDGDLFEPAEPGERPVAVASVEARLNEALADPEGVKDELAVPPREP